MTTPTANIDVGDLQQRILSMALSTGYFQSVAGHEPVSPPPNGLTAGLWLQIIRPDPKRSGVDKTAGRVEFVLRIFVNTAGNDPATLDSIDPQIATATAAVMAAVSADFTLGGEVFAADLEGMGGTPLSAKAGWAAYADAKLRVMDITIPLILDAVWQQGAAA